MEENEVNQNEPKKTKNGKGKTIVLMVIVLILVLTIGVLAGLFISGNGDKVTNIINQGTNKEENKLSKKVEESKPWVYEAEYCSTNENKKAYGEFAGEEYDSKEYLKVPYININSDYAKKVNKEIQELYDKEYEAFGKKSGDQQFVAEFEYKWYNTDKVLSVAIEHKYGWTNAGFGSEYIIYNINLDTLEEATYEDVYKECGFANSESIKLNAEIALLNMNDESEGALEGTVIKYDKYYLSKEGLNFLIPNGVGNPMPLTVKPGMIRVERDKATEKNEFSIETNDEEKYYSENIWYTCDTFKIKLPKSWEGKYTVNKENLGDGSGEFYSFICKSDNEVLFSIEVTNKQIEDDSGFMKLLGTSANGIEVKYVYMVDRRDAPINPEPSGSMMRDFQYNKDDIFIMNKFDNKTIYAKNMIELKGSMYRYYRYYIDENDRLCILNYNKDVTIEYIADYADKLVYDENENAIHAYPIGKSFMNNISREVEEIIFEKNA